jgi:hypothetical protein
MMFILISMLVMQVSAHSGGTDASGGHWNRSTGEYHYHHGYPAHDHYDLDGDGDMDCPYDFEDKTDRNNNHSQSAENDSEPEAKKKSQLTLKTLWSILVFSFYSSIIVWLIIAPIADKLIKKDYSFNIDIVIFVLLFIVAVIIFAKCIVDF